MSLKPKDTRRSDSYVQQTGTTIASTWTPSVDSTTAVLPASAPGNILLKCAVCKDLLVTNDGLDMSFRAMCAASRSGCQSCSLVAHVLRAYGVDLTTDGNVYLLVEGDSTLKLRFDGAIFEGTLEEVDLFVLEDSTCPWLSIRARPIEQASYSATLSADQITRWMEDCSANHGSMICGRASAPKQLPTRLLQIIGHQKLRLYTPSSKERGCYVCLSHCWGGSVALQTTHATELEFCDNIPWHLLPRTFKDAVDLTWRLGLQYLWIDSLCILQDDIDDWRHEGSKMASIYSNSFITLAATKSANCNGGLYTTEETHRKINLHRVRDKCGEVHMIHSSRAMLHRGFGLSQLPLLTRAWALQERLLPPRVVHFACEELFWECTDKGTCECETINSPLWYGFRRRSRSGFLSMNASGAPIPSEKIESMARDWRNLVCYYTTLHLTFQTDTLTALQGIAKAMQLVRNCSYYAGLWEDTLVEDLLWYYTELDTSKAPFYQPPSWSWASRKSDGFVAWYRHRGKRVRHAHIAAVSVTPKGLDPTGEVHAGSIIISGRRITAHLGFKDEKPSLVVLSSILQDDGTSRSYTPSNWSFDIDITLGRAMEVELLELAVDNFELKNIITFLCLRSVEHNAAKSDYPTGDDIPTFERIGIGQFYLSEEVVTCFESQPGTIRLV